MDGNVLNSREIAAVIWIVVVVAYALFREGTRASARSVVQAALAPKLLMLYALFALWGLAVIFLAWEIGLWDWRLLKDTIIVWLGVCLPVLGASLSKKNMDRLFRLVFAETLAFTALLSFFIGIETMPLLLEFLLVPVITVLAVASSGGAGSADVKRLGRLGLTVVGLGLIGWTVVRLIVNWSELDWPELLRQFLVAIWLPLAYLPFNYVMAIYAGLESVLSRQSALYGSMPAAAKLGMIAGFRLNPRWVKSFGGRYNRVFLATTFREALRAMRAFRKDVSAREELEKRRLIRLRQFNGVSGLDQNGAQLDRREFSATKKALDFISIAQIGRYESLGQRFWDDLTEMVLIPLDRWPLPEDHGIVVETTPDRKIWRAYRVLPSGWVLGVGGDGRSYRYHYSERRLPETWPGEEGWLSELVETPTDWTYDDDPIQV